MNGGIKYLSPETYFSRDYSSIKDPAWSARAYAIINCVLDEMAQSLKPGGTASSEEFLDYFCDFMLDNYGSLAYMVLNELGLTGCGDLYEIASSVLKAGFSKTPCFFQPEKFIGYYNFKTEFASAEPRD